MAAETRVTLLGTRGTVPVEGEEFSRYGGATVCVLVHMGGEAIVLDGGTGIMSLHRHLRAEDRVVHLLLSHGHFDHMTGLPSCPVLYDPNHRVRLYAAPRDGLDPRQLLERLMSPPLWPVGPEAFQASFTCHTIDGAPFSLGEVSVQVAEGAHPGGCTLFRLEYGGVSVVYASDYELDEDSAPALEQFARNCSLLLCDGHYSQEEFDARRGYGHSAWQSAVHLATRCGARHLRLLHHAPWRTDAVLDRATPLLRQMFPNGSFGQWEEVIVL